MTRFIPLTDSFMVAGQLTPGDMARARESGIRRVICNRPDNEAPDQPESAEMAAAARAAGLAFDVVPVLSSGFTMENVAALSAILRRESGPVLAYCRSGTRSTVLWALAQAKLGADTETVSQQVRAAGYDCSSVRPTMELLREGRG